MKTNTLLLIGGAALALYLFTKPKAASSTPYVPPSGIPQWQGPVYQPSAEDIIYNSVETGIAAALHTIPGIYT